MISGFYEVFQLNWSEHYIWQHDTKAAIKHFTHRLYSFNVSPLIHSISHWAVSMEITNASFQFSRTEEWSLGSKKKWCPLLSIIGDGNTSTTFCTETEISGKTKVFPLFRRYLTTNSPSCNSILWSPGETTSAWYGPVSCQYEMRWWWSPQLLVEVPHKSPGSEYHHQYPSPSFHLPSPAEQNDWPSRILGLHFPGPLCWMTWPHYPDWKVGCLWLYVAWWQ